MASPLTIVKGNYCTRLTPDGIISWLEVHHRAEVWTLGGLVTFYVLFFIKLDTREVHIAGITSSPNEQWMMQVARNLTMEEWGMLKPGQYLIHDGDKKFCPPL